MTIFSILYFAISSEYMVPRVCINRLFPVVGYLRSTVRVYCTNVSTGSYLSYGICIRLFGCTVRMHQLVLTCRMVSSFGCSGVLCECINWVFRRRVSALGCSGVFCECINWFLPVVGYLRSAVWMYRAYFNQFLQLVRKYVIIKEA